MAEKYSVETHISANPQSWFDIEDISRKEDNCTCLYISYFQNDLHFWILKTGGVLHFKRISVEENLVQAGLPKDLPLSKFLADCLQPLSPRAKELSKIATRGGTRGRERRSHFKSIFVLQNVYCPRL